MTKAGWQPTVSVVMCTFNGAPFLPEQMDSILTQTYPIYEFLIFDDGSVDGTAAIIEDYVKKYPFIRFQINPVNLGYNLNFQQALKAASGEVIAIADQDDVWHPQKIELMLAHWKADRPLIHCDSQRFEKTLPKTNPGWHLYKRFQGTETKQLFVYNSISGHAMLMRRSFLPLILPLQKNIYYDWWAGVVATCHGGVDYLDNVLVYQRVHNRNASIKHEGTEQEKFVRYRDEIITHLKKFISLPALQEEDRQAGEQLLQHMTHLDSTGNRFRCFLFILKNRHWFFSTKKRKVAIISHFKHAIRWAFY